MVDAAGSLVPAPFPSGRYAELRVGTVCGRQVAVKLVHLVTVDDQVLSRLQHEVLVLAGLCHPNIMSYDSAMLIGDRLQMTMALADNGSCRRLLDQHFPFGFTEILIRHIVCSLLSAVHYIHSNRIVHGRICAKNMLLDRRGHPYLTGFDYARRVCHANGTSRILHHLPDNIVEFLPWCAPEVLKQDLQGYGTPSDIYSVGALAVELGNGVAPYVDQYEPLPPSLILIEKLNGFTPRLLDTKSLKDNMEDDSVDPSYKQRTFSDEFHDLVTLCCNVYPERRPKAEYLVRFHPFSNSAELARSKHCIDVMSCLPAPPSATAADHQQQQEHRTSQIHIHTITEEDEELHARMASVSIQPGQFEWDF